MAEVHNLLLDQLNIRNGSEGLAAILIQEASPCVNCSRFNHVELDCPVMVIQGHDICRVLLLGILMHVLVSKLIFLNAQTGWLIASN